MISLTDIDDSRAFRPAVSRIIIATAFSFEPFHMMATKRSISCMHG